MIDKQTASLKLAMLMSLLIERLEQRFERDDLTESPLAMVRRELDLIDSEVEVARAKYDSLSDEDRNLAMQELIDSITEAVGEDLELDDTPPRRGDLQ